MLRTRKPQWLIMLVLALAYLAGGLHRLEGTLARGILDHDEGHALLNANTWHRVTWWVMQGGMSDGPEAMGALRDEFHREGGTLYTAGKFGYSLLLAAVALPAEVSVREGLTLAWVCGLMIPLLAGGIVWHFTRSLLAAVVAGAGCWSSPLLLTLSQEVSGTLWALMVALAGFYLLQRGVLVGRPWRWGIPGGVLLAAGFTCHFNIAPFIVAALVSAVLFARGRRGTWRESARDVAAPLLGFALVIGVLEAATQYADYRLRDVFPEYRSMLGDLWHILTNDQARMAQGVAHGHDMAMGWGRDAWGFWLSVGARKEPGLLLLVALFLPALLWVNRSIWRAWLPAAALVVVPFLFYAAHPAKVERVLGMVVAAAWILLAAAAAPQLAQWSRVNGGGAVKARLVCLALLAGMVLPVFLPRARVPAPESPMPGAVEETLRYVQTEGGTITAAAFDSSFEPVWKWTIVEALRRPEFASVRGAVDFSSREESDYIFEARRLGREQSGDDSSRDSKSASGTVVTRVRTLSPPWSLRVVKVR